MAKGRTCDLVPKAPEVGRDPKFDSCIRMPSDQITNFDAVKWHDRLIAQPVSRSERPMEQVGRCDAVRRISIQYRRWERRRSRPSPPNRDASLLIQGSVNITAVDVADVLPQT
jgi:hypothetical protein